MHEILIINCVVCAQYYEQSVHFGQSSKFFADEIYHQHAKNKLNDKTPAIARRKVPHMGMGLRYLGSNDDQDKEIFIILTFGPITSPARQKLNSHIIWL